MKPTIEPPTEDRASYLVRVDYVISYEGDSVAVDCTVEFPTDDDECYLLSLEFADGWTIGGDEIDEREVAEIKAEARAELEANGIEL